MKRRQAAAPCAASEPANFLIMRGFGPDAWMEKPSHSPVNNSSDTIVLHKVTARRLPSDERRR
jgi:hypothetical protein